MQETATHAVRLVILRYAVQSVRLSNVLLTCRSANAQLQMLPLPPQLPLALVVDLVSQLAVVSGEVSAVVSLVATVRQPATSVEDQITLLAIARRRP